MAHHASSRTSKPAKIFHKIGEVCDATQTEPYVLRYWESEFPFLAPEKNRAGQRIYSDDDIQLVLAIKRLLYEEGYTTAGARRRLEKELQDRRTAGAPEAGTQHAAVSTRGQAPEPGKAAPAGKPRPDDPEGVLERIRLELVAIRALLRGESAPAPSAQGPRTPPRRGTGKRPAGARARG